MSRYPWQIVNESTGNNYTTDVLSLSFNVGRQAYLDTYNTCFLNLTIKNDTNQSSNFNYGDLIYLKYDPVVGPDNNLYGFYVSEISYSDYPGNTGLSTATIRCQDGLGLMGRLQMDNFAVTAGTTGDQFDQLDLVPGKLPNRPGLVSTTSLGSLCSSANYYGSVLNFINLLVNTERALLAHSENYYTFITRLEFAGKQLGGYFDRTASATSIGYERFERINLGLDLINQAQTQPAGLADQQATNTTSVNSYGAQGITISTVDANTTQALGLAEWVANTLSDLTKQRFVLTFTDVAQTMTEADFSLFVESLGNCNRYYVNYLVPGDSSETSVQTICEGFNVSATPSQTVFTVYLTPLTYYQFFTLDSDVLGILGGGGLTYNQPEIVYDETEWVYNDALVEQGSRLGW
jgi:disulfide oxidoreductase YuzD